MLKNLGGWIHNFTVTETNTHKKGYTVYKITSIVFPRAVPEALTVITVWKRFSEVKKLYRELSKRHKSLHLRIAALPEHKESSYFKRFDSEVIRERKQYILQLLDFVAQHPALYKSHPFQTFFENTNTPNASPVHKSNIESICDNLDIPYETDIQLVDPNKDNNEQSATGASVIDSLVLESANDESACMGNQTVKEVSDDGDTASIISTPSIFQIDNDDNDYIYEAAYEFSRAVQAEVNQQYKEAFERYKSGIDKLLSGSKNDTNEDRKSIAKAKVTKYLLRSEDIYEKHILSRGSSEKLPLQLSVDEADSSTDTFLERPWNQLSKFKVMKIIDTVMQVQDITEKRVYIMKAIEKPSTNSNSQSIFLPQNVPYMVGLVGFFQSETNIYLLLQQAKGGKLFDYIQTYTSTGHITKTLSDIFTDPDKLGTDNLSETLETDSSYNEQTVTNYDSGFVELLNDYKNGEEELTSESPMNDNSSASKNEIPIEKESYSKIEIEIEKQEYIPSFDVLSKDMDINDLVNCSQKLLKSVSNTLEQVREIQNNNKIDRDNDKVKYNGENKANGHVLNREDQSIDINKTDEIFSVVQIMREEKKSIPETVFCKRIFLPEPIVKQWARELLTAIESLHWKGIILGDLHPDNILLGSKGQLLLSYFYKNEGIDSLPQLIIDQLTNDGLYVAPERPITTTSDWWSFGVILYQLLTGYTFKSCHPGGLSAYYEIQYPEIDISNQSTDLLDGLLQYNPDIRMNVVQIKGHPFFDGTNWEDISQIGVNSF